jgi:hypothetical protein
MMPQRQKSRWWTCDICWIEEKTDAKQRLSKHTSAATNTNIKIKELLEAVLSTWSVSRLHNDNQQNKLASYKSRAGACSWWLPMCMEVEESLLLEATSKQWLVRTQWTEKT